MGQTCICANRLYAQAGVYDEFVQKLSTKTAAIKIREAAVRACTLSMSGAIAVQS
ncbi:acyl-CoA reductase-like NAD-dependent aldehyde dehydrogenase [Bradyrhizobium sp. LM2.7]